MPLGEQHEEGPRLGLPRQAKFGATLTAKRKVK